MVDSRWAVLKCKFVDDDSETPPDDLYERLFTEEGNGSSNMVDYFRDVSHGQLDLSMSKVFGWFELNLRKDDFAGNVPDSALTAGQVNRRERGRCGGESRTTRSPDARTELRISALRLPGT